MLNLISARMENFFNINHKLVFTKKEDIFGRFDSICKISSANLVAFSSEIDIATNLKGFFIFVFDINLPWCAYKVSTRKYPISSLEWDQEGAFLLVADNYGNVSVYAMESNLLNFWVEIKSVRFPRYDNSDILRSYKLHSTFYFVARTSS